MRVLCLEASGPEGSVAVRSGGETEFSRSFPCPRGRGGRMFPVLAEALAASAPPNTIVVGTGPGSYNGLRMAAAAAHGLARTRGIRLQGVPSLLGYEAEDYFVAGDARGGRWFLARVTGGIFAFPPELLAPESALARLEPDVPVFSSSGELAGLERAVIRPPSAAVLASRIDSFGNPSPIYLKPPHITRPGERDPVRT